MASKNIRSFWAASCCMLVLPLLAVRLAAAEHEPTPGPAPDAPEFTEKKSVDVTNILAGNWVGVSASRDGEPFKSIRSSDARLKLLDRRHYTFVYKYLKGTIHAELGGPKKGHQNWLVDATKTPSVFYLASGDKNDRTLPAAVFELDGDVLTWRLLDNQERPPYSLAAKAGGGQAAVRLRRERKASGAVATPKKATASRPTESEQSLAKPAIANGCQNAVVKGLAENPQQAKPSADTKSLKAANALLGHWVGVAFSRDGAPFKPIGPKDASLDLPNRSVFSFQVESAADDISQAANGMAIPGPHWTVDGTKTPMEFMVNIGQGEHADRTAVFQLDGDQLTWCLVATSERPPFSLATKKGDGHIVVRFRREDKKR